MPYGIVYILLTAYCFFDAPTLRVTDSLDSRLGAGLLVDDVHDGLPLGTPARRSASTVRI